MLSSLPVVFPLLLNVISNNLGFYKQVSIICTTVLGVISKPPFSEAGFNLSHGLQTHNPVGLTTFPTLDKLPISLGFAISAHFSCMCGVVACLLPHCLLCVCVRARMPAPTLSAMCVCVWRLVQVSVLSVSCLCVFVLPCLAGLAQGVSRVLQNGERPSHAKPVFVRALHSK